MEYVGKYSPSILDAFQSYLDCEALYEKFFGHSEEPSQTYEEYEQQKFQELIDKVNREPFESEAASRGACLNEIVDCIIMNTKSTRDDIVIRSVPAKEIVHDSQGYIPIQGGYGGDDVWYEQKEPPYIEAKNGNYTFRFDIDFCKRLAEYFKDSLCQIYTEAPIETRYGKVLLYGYPDYVRENKVYDLKTTSKYEFGKYSKYWQQHVYPYTLIESGKVTEVQSFEFTAFQMKGGTARSPLIYGDMYPEVYVYSHEASTKALRGICEQFTEFLTNNKHLIKDEKIFGGEKKAR